MARSTITILLMSAIEVLAKSRYRLLAQKQAQPPLCHESTDHSLTRMKLRIRDWIVNVHHPRAIPQQVFIRYGLWDSSNRSYNHSSGLPELGLSVYPARWDSGAIRLDEHQLNLDAFHAALADRYAFPVTGRVVGYGSDGEPVLKAVRVLPYPLHLSTRIKQGSAVHARSASAATQQPKS